MKQQTLKVLKIPTLSWISWNILKVKKSFVTIFLTDGMPFIATLNTYIFLFSFNTKNQHL